MKNLNLENVELIELNQNELSQVDGGGFGPFGAGFRIFFKPAFIVSEQYA
ncbi:hypothetical protein PQ465_03655 [Sphingobacterium oryzagri]|uniref:Bacteriocin-type signal sequence-containing protein n=1 Tax=Sphingobacterium oryzagri TaxID=3025669 RepID=A0ABY7WQ63_9SPHI|nr:hypothetical protein [Sphingobacterium sp. KACC 22765]WDF69479.1 hypothetical protein PQ465_03655 [Sphingobacterium sp. KACC 22765]